MDEVSRDRMETNRRRWDELVPMHVASRGADGFWRLPDGDKRIAFLFSLRASKPAI